MLGLGLISMEFQCKHNIPTRKERFSLDKYSILNIPSFGFFLHKSLNIEEHIDTKQLTKS